MSRSIKSVDLVWAIHLWSFSISLVCFSSRLSRSRYSCKLDKELMALWIQWKSFSSGLLSSAYSGFSNRGYERFWSPWFLSGVLISLLLRLLFEKFPQLNKILFFLSSFRLRSTKWEVLFWQDRFPTDNDK